MAPRTETTDNQGGGQYTLEPGEYHFKVVEESTTGGGFSFRTEDGESRNGDPQIKMVLMVGDEHGQVMVLESLTFSNRAAFRISQFLKSAGAYPGPGLEIDLDAERCIGLHGKCTTINEPNSKGYDRTKIDTWVEAQEQNPDKIPGLLGGPPPKPQPVNDDDIPY